MWRDHRAGRVEEPKHDATLDTGFVQGVRLVRHDRNNATKVFVEEGVGVRFVRHDRQNATRVVVEEGVGVRFVRHDRRHPKPANASKVFLDDPVWLI